MFYVQTLLNCAQVEQTGSTWSHKRHPNSSSAEGRVPHMNKHICDRDDSQHVSTLTGVRSNVNYKYTCNQMKDKHNKSKDEKEVFNRSDNLIAGGISFILAQ